MAIGIILSNLVPSTGPALQQSTFVGVSVPIAVGLLVMMSVSLSTGLILAWAFLPDRKDLREGLIFVGIARCIAMVLIWTDLSNGDGDYCAILVAFNSVLQMILFAPFAVFYTNVVSNDNDLAGLSYSLVAQSVGVFLGMPTSEIVRYRSFSQQSGIPLGAAIATRLSLRYLLGERRYQHYFIRTVGPLSLIGLLYTIIVLFGSEGKNAVHQITDLLRVCAPLVVYFATTFSFTVFLCWKFGFGYRVSCTQSFTVASNNFELAIAVVVAVYGASSGQALASTAGPLIEVPVLVSCTYIIRYLQRKLKWQGGPYPVGTIDLEIPASSLPQTVQKPESAPATVALRLYYPCQHGARSSKPVRWISQPQQEYLASVYRFLGLSSSIASWTAYALPQLKYASLPACRDAPVASPLSTQGSSAAYAQSTRPWPVLIFSHGLGGSRNAYSYICGTLASYGLVVAAPDHRDGSQPASFVRETEEEASRHVPYITLKHQPCRETFQGRDEQLRVRMWEISALAEALAVVNDGTPRLEDLHDSTDGSTAVLGQLKHRLDLSPGAVTFVGHSFGATTMFQLLKSVFYSQGHHAPSSLYTPITPTPALTSQITSRTPAIFLDPWGLPLVNPAQSFLHVQPLPAYQDPATEPPYLTVMSQAFYEWRSNREEILQAFKPPADYPAQFQNPLIFYPAASAHLSQSDFGPLFPRLTKYLAKAEEPTRLIALNVRAILEMLRRRGIEVEKYNLEQAGEAAELDEDGWVDLGDEREAGDAKILRKESEAVRGWKFVPLMSRDSSGNVDGANDNTYVGDDCAVDDEGSGPVGVAKALVVHGRKRSPGRGNDEVPELSDEKIDSGTEEDLDGVIDSGKA
ncbi:MAG: hypothetical protein Q9162_007746 [Coniocarpon cinnabarinum]